MSPTRLSSRKTWSTRAVFGINMTTSVTIINERRSAKSVSAKAYPAGMLARSVRASAASE